MIIDFHAHIYPDVIAKKATEGIRVFYDIEMDRVGTVSELLRSGDDAGVDKFVVHSVATSAKQVSSINHFIADQCKLHEGRMIGFGTMHPDVDDFSKALDELQALSLQGIKMHPDFQKFNIDDRKAYPMYEEASARGIPILLHVGDFRYDYSHPLRFKQLMKDFPKLTVIGAHFGGWSIWEEASEILADTNCFVDTSSSLYALSPEKAREIIHRYGAERVLFGVDFPMWHHRGELDMIEALNLTQEELELIFYKNALRIISI